MASDFSPLWQKMDANLVKDWVKNPNWLQIGEFWLDSLGSCKYGLHGDRVTVIDGKGNVWVAKWPNLMVSLDDQVAE